MIVKYNQTVPNSLELALPAPKSSRRDSRAGRRLSFPKLRIDLLGNQFQSFDDRSLYTASHFQPLKSWCLNSLLW